MRYTYLKQQLVICNEEDTESAGGSLFETWEDCSRVTVVEFRADNGGSDGTGCFRIKVRTDTAEFSDMRIAGLRM